MTRDANTFPGTETSLANLFFKSKITKSIFTITTFPNFLNGP